MKSTGRYCPVTDGYDLSEKINEVVDLTQKFIKELRKEVGDKDYTVIARVIIQEHLNSMKLESSI